MKSIRLCMIWNRSSGFSSGYIYTITRPDECSKVVPRFDEWNYIDMRELAQLCWLMRYLRVDIAHVLSEV